tara:strand:+ start:151 stop:258 length:108 start_codon:yes stop_codon:yes gene_type:complete
MNKKKKPTPKKREFAGYYWDGKKLHKIYEKEKGTW